MTLPALQVHRVDWADHTTREQCSPVEIDSFSFLPPMKKSIGRPSGDQNGKGGRCRAGDGNGALDGVEWT